LRTGEVSAAKTVFHFSRWQARYRSISRAGSTWGTGSHFRSSIPFKQDRARCGCVGHCLGIDHRRRGFGDWISNSFRQSGHRAMLIGDGILLVSRAAVRYVGCPAAGPACRGYRSGDRSAGARRFLDRWPLIRTSRNRDSSQAPRLVTTSSSSRSAQPVNTTIS